VYKADVDPGKTDQAVQAQARNGAIPVKAEEKETKRVSGLEWENPLLLPHTCGKKSGLKG